jgi:two-component system, OmpR family, response regulator ResD
VLIVGNDVAMRSSIIRMLERANYEVGLAQDGHEAAIRFVPEQVGLVLLDLNLPSRDGWDAFECLTTRYPFVPIIIMMEKPIEARDLLKTVEEVLAEPEGTQPLRLCG